MKIMKYVGMVSLCLWVSVMAVAQKGDRWAELKAVYKDEPAVFLDHSETVSIQVKDDSLVMVATNSEQILYLKEQSDAFVNRKVHGSHFQEAFDLKAKTMVWEKNKYRDFNVTSFQKKADQDDGIFYDDSYNYAFSFPALAMQNISELEYKIRYKDPRFMPGFIFGNFLPQEKTSYSIKTTKDVDLVYQVINDPNNEIQFKKYEKGTAVYYEWSATNTKAFKTESNSPSIRYYVPHLIVYVKSYKTKSGTTKTVLSSVDDLYKWYNSFVKDLNKEPSADLAAVVSKLKSPLDSEEETVKKIFYWVQDNIRYIAFEDGMRGFIPHNGSYVCEKRYGDCKDMANLLVSMMRIANIKAYHTWIGTRDLPYAYSQVPTPMVDNHMIATYISPSGQYYFLDATSNHTAFGLPSSMIQGKEALIGLGPDKYEIKKVPEIKKESNEMTDSIEMQIKNNELIGKGTASVMGYPKVFAGYRLNRSQEVDIKNYLARLVGKGSNKFYLDNYKITNLNEYDKATEIDYDFRIGDYFQRISGEIYINMNLNKEYYNEYINLANRTAPWENDYRFVKKEVCVLDIPEGYAIDYVPKDAHFDGKNIGINVHYDVTPQKVTLNKTFYIDFLMLQPDQFQNWNESVKSVSEVYKESIILKKK